VRDALFAFSLSLYVMLMLMVRGGRLKAIIKPRSIPILKNRLFFAADAQLSRTSLSFFWVQAQTRDMIY